MKHLREYRIDPAVPKGKWIISARFGYEWDRYMCDLASLRRIVPKLRARRYVREVGRIPLVTKEVGRFLDPFSMP